MHLYFHLLGYHRLGQIAQCSCMCTETCSNLGKKIFNHKVEFTWEAPDINKKRGEGGKFCRLVHVFWVLWNRVQWWIMGEACNDRYPFHIKPIMRSQRRFENNAVWCERSEAALFDTGVRKGAFYVGGLLLPRDGVLEAYSSQKPQSATVRLSMWKGAPNNAEGKAKQCIGVMLSFCSILLRFLNHTFQNAENPMLGVKANRSALEYSSSKADELKVVFSAEWLRIWRYERGKSWNNSS